MTPEGKTPLSIGLVKKQHRTKATMNLIKSLEVFADLQELQEV